GPSAFHRVRPSCPTGPLSKQPRHKLPMVPRRMAHDPYLSCTGGWRRPSRAVRHLRGCGSCDRSDQPTDPALHQVCEHVQPRIDCRTERLRDDPRPTDPMHLIMGTAMENLTKHELNLREEPGSATTDPPSTQADGARAQPSKLKVVVRQARAKHDQHPLMPKKPEASERRFVARVVLPWTSRLATLVLALVAVLISIVAWNHYVMAPWTRNGRIRVQVASIAPQISGQITEVRIADNQFVHKGDVLYVIDPFDFEVALRTNTASLKQKAADVLVKELQSE